MPSEATVGSEVEESRRRVGRSRPDARYNYCYACAMKALDKEALTAQIGALPADVVVRSDEVRRIREAIQRLNPSDREIITLSYDRELSCREIMEVMGKPSITSVTTHLYQAMKRLRELVRLSEEAAARQVAERLRA